MTDPAPAVLAAVISCTDRAIPTPRQAQEGEVSETSSEREQKIADLVETLEFEDRRGSTPPLVNYWFETTGGGWVRPDWRRIAEIAVDFLGGIR